MAYNQYDLATNSLVKTGILTEMYIPLWWYSSGNTNVSGSGSSYLQKGTSVMTTDNTLSQVKFHTLSSAWNPNQKFAFECSAWTNNSAYSYTFTLYDMTTKQAVNSSAVAGNNTTATIVRSGQFTLTPGHSYGIVCSGLVSYPFYLTKASLIAFLS